MDRRSFLKGGLAAGAVAALGASVVGCAPAPKDMAATGETAGGVACPAGATLADFEDSAAVLEPITDIFE